MKYEAPALTQIGKAEVVIRGQFDWGSDVDSNYWLPELEFLCDGEMDSPEDRTTP
jgi:hypothetical protein